MTTAIKAMVLRLFEAAGKSLSVLTTAQPAASRAATPHRSRASV